jgi:hypothetical protein
MTEDIKEVEADHAFITEVLLIMNALIILYTILDDVIINEKSNPPAMLGRME